MSDFQSAECEWGQGGGAGILGLGKKGRTLAAGWGQLSGRRGLRLGLELSREGQETELAGPGREENGAGVCVCPEYQEMLTVTF